MVVIIPCCGQSERFDGTKKQFLTHPSGLPLPIYSASGIQGAESFLYVFIKNEFLERYGSTDAFLSIAKTVGQDADVVLLDEQTESVFQTVKYAVKFRSVTGPALVKDCDSYFELPGVPDLNFVCSVDISEVRSIRKKGYLHLGHACGFAQHFTGDEKVSQYVSAGGYCFTDINEFLKAPDCFTMGDILNCTPYPTFIALAVKNYEDYGDMHSWTRYLRERSTWFIDIDGILFVNKSGFNGERTKRHDEISANVDQVRRIKNAGGYVVLVSARSESERAATVHALQYNAIPYDSLLLGLPHSPRVLVNDHSRSNPYPAAAAHSLVRDSHTLKWAVDSWLL